MMLNKTLIHDVIIDILSWLPAKSLIRFKCVDKSRYALIESHEFLGMQLRNHVSSFAFKKEEYFLFQSCEGTYDQRRMFLSMLRYDGEVVYFVEKDIKLFEEPRFIMSSHYDGIVCFYYHYDNQVIIANPGIRQFRTLRESCVPPPVPDPVYGFSRYTEAVGLGFDLETNDHKVVRVLNTWVNALPHTFEAEVYSLSSNSWRQIEFLNLNEPFDFFSQESSRLCNGSYYWFASKGYVYPKNGLCAFNFSDEMFQFFRLPEYVSHSPHGVDHPDLNIVELNKDLAVFVFKYYLNDDDSMDCFDIWVMKELGVCETWTKLLSFEAPVWYYLGFLGNDQLLVMFEEHFTSYDLVTQETKVLSPIPIDSEINYYKVISYRTSLISINFQKDNN